MEGGGEVEGGGSEVEGDGEGRCRLLISGLVCLYDSRVTFAKLLSLLLCFMTVK